MPASAVEMEKAPQCFDSRKSRRCSTSKGIAKETDTSHVFMLYLPITTDTWAEDTHIVRVVPDLS